ncbi:hypothetical protein KR038_006131 [Drosophila bunnanda]|nr:hypothetical protein KR038_006131 [Drosophila bunnanda]
MQALMAEIKSALVLLENDSEPEELHIRACMGITVQLMKDLRNTIVESGQYGEQVTSHTSEVLAECRTKLGFLFRSVPCHAEGGKVTPEVQRCFLKVMNFLIVQFDNIFREYSIKQNIRDPEIHQNLKLFKKLTAKRRREIEDGPMNELCSEYLQNKLQHQKIKEHNEQLMASQTSIQLEFNAFRSNGGDATDIYAPKRSKNSHHNPSEQVESQSSWITKSSQVQLGSTTSDSIFNTLKEPKSDVTLVGSLQSNESQRTLRMKSGQNQQDLPKDNSKLPSHTFSDINVKDVPQLVKTRSKIDIQENLRVQKNSTSSDFVFNDLSELESNVPMVGSYQNIEAKDLQVLWAKKAQPMNQTKCTHSDFKLKDLSEFKSNETMFGSFQNIDRQTSLRMENRQDVNVLWVHKEKQRIQTSSSSQCLDFVLKNLPQLEKDRNQSNLTTESPQDLLVQRSFTYSHSRFKDLPQNEGCQTVSASSDLFKDLPQPEKVESKSSCITACSQNTHVIQTGSTPSDFIVRNLPQPEKDKSQPSLTAESPPDLQVLCAQKEKSVAQKSLTTSHPRFKDLLQNDESKTNLRINGLQIQQPASSDLFKDLTQPEKVESQPSWISEHSLSLEGSKSSGFKLAKLSQPEKDESQRNLTTESADLSVQKDKAIIQTGSSPSYIIFKNLTKPESEVTLEGSLQNTESKGSLKMESRQDQQVSQSQKENSKDKDKIQSPQNLQVVYTSSTFPYFIVKDLQQSENDTTRGSTSSYTRFKDVSQTDGSKANLRIQDRQIEKPMMQTVSTSTYSLFEDLPQPEKVKSQRSWSTESSQNPQVIQTGSNSSDFIFKDLSQPAKDKSQQNFVIDNARFQTSSTSGSVILKNLQELESNMALAGSFQNIRSHCGLWRASREDLSALCVQKDCGLWRASREDLSALCVQKDKPVIPTSSTSSDFVLRNDPLPEEVESKTCLVRESAKHLKDLWTRTEKPIVLTSSSSSDFSVNKPSSCIKTLTNCASAEIPSANRSLEIKKLKTAGSFFSLGKTFGDHRLRLLRWCQERTKDYGVPMYEFSESWRNGRALVALIHSYRKDLIEDRFNPEDRQIKESPRDTLTCGANAAKSLGVDSKVDIVRVCLKRVPDFFQVFTFVGELQRCLDPKL